ncbi:MAG: hypothetical protein AMJ81_12480, partial [Phycisphaerae bacterium SM23_33]
MAAVLAAGCQPRAASRRRGAEEGEKPAERTARRQAYYAGIPEAVEKMLPEIRRRAQALADLGPRQTGQQGCDRALEYLRAALAEVAPNCPITTFSTPVTVALDRVRTADLALADEPHTHVLIDGLGPAPQRWPAYAFAPNCIQPCATHPPQQCPLREQGNAGPSCPNCELARRLVDLGSGSWAEFRGKDLTDAVVLLDFNSDDAWLRAASLGAAGALIIEPTRTTVFQADKKYLATLPLHFPRLYLSRARGLELRAALAQRPDALRVTLAGRLNFQNVPAQCLELTIPGKDRSYCFVLAGHFDARCIVPDLAYGGDEVWGIAELIELTRYLTENQPNCDVRIIFVSGHWQSQRPMRQYISPDAGRFDRIGVYFKLAMAVDLVPQGRAINLINESPWDVQSRGMYKWLGTRLFADGGWREQIFDGMGLSPKQVEMYGGERSTLSETGEGNLADRKDRSAFLYAPRYCTAEQAWQALGISTFAFQTARLARLAHNTPLDRFRVEDPAADDDQLRPQLEMTLGVLRHLFDYPRKLMRDNRPSLRRGRGWAGYTQIDGRLLQWDRSIGWFAQRLPADSKGRPLKTFIHAYPTDMRFTAQQGGRLRNYLNWPMAPTRGQHRELQAFMFQDLWLLDESHFRIHTVYAAYPETQYDVVAYSLDEAGRICFATDYGVHGDGNKAFQCTDMDLVGSSVYVPVSVFECGTLELFDLIDPQRYNPGSYVFGSWYHNYGYQNADGGVAPHLRITDVKDVESHTDMERWGFTQYGPTAMVFLPAEAQVGAEVLLGSFFTNVAILNNPADAGQPMGYKLHSGQTVRLTSSAAPTPLACIRQLQKLDQQRLEEFALHDVASPL